MKRLFTFTLFALLAAMSCVWGQDERIFSITASPAEETEKQMNFSWGTNRNIGQATLEVTTVKDKRWKKSKKQVFKGELCTTYDSVYSKTPDGQDFYEEVVFNKYSANIKGLKKNSAYKYRIVAAQDTTEVRYFHTAGSREWSACIISDFHAYAPLYGRTKAAMDMIKVVEGYGRPFEWVLHLGDITAWGGSYSFWKELYKETPFKNYMWAGVNGNHDNMTRGYKRTTNEFFRDAAAYPRNGYEGEEGVCYYFRYGDVLFIMLNNESMRQEEGLQAAQAWVRKVVAENPAPYKVVCEHYQWFFGTDGKDSQYGRWCKLFDELGIDLALGANNHIYISTHPLREGKVVDEGEGTVYLQTTSSDNERGQGYPDEPLKHNAEKVKFRWSEGANTVSALHMDVTPKQLTLTLLDRTGRVLDTVVVKRKR